MDPVFQLVHNIENLDWPGDKAKQFLDNGVQVMQCFSYTLVDRLKTRVD